MLLAGLVLISCVGTKIPVYVVPLLAPLGVLTTRALAAMAPEASRRVWAFVAGYLLTLALAFPWLDAFRPAWPTSIRGLLPLAVLFGVTAAAVFLARARGLVAAVCAFVAGLTVLSPVLSLVVLRSVDPYLNPRQTAVALARYMDRGYAETLYKTWPGCFSYHARRSVFETRDVAVLRERAKSSGPVVLVMARKYFDRLLPDGPLVPPGFSVVGEQWIIDQPYVVAVKPASDGT
jgi:hypothetical protein